MIEAAEKLRDLRNEGVKRWVHHSVAILNLLAASGMTEDAKAEFLARQFVDTQLLAAMPMIPVAHERDPLMWIDGDGYSIGYMGGLPAVFIIRQGAHSWASYDLKVSSCEDGSFSELGSRSWTADDGKRAAESHFTRKVLVIQ